MQGGSCSVRFLAPFLSPLSPTHVGIPRGNKVGKMTAGASLGATIMCENDIRAYVGRNMPCAHLSGLVVLSVVILGM